MKAVIVTGSGSSFSAGVDLFRVIKDGPEYGRRFLPVLDDFLRAALTLPKPMVAAINGHAIAGGCILAAACDHRIMTEGNGRIGIPELAVGVPFPALPLADHGGARRRRSASRSRLHRPHGADRRSQDDGVDR